MSNFDYFVYLSYEHILCKRDHLSVTFYVLKFHSVNSMDNVKAKVHCIAWIYMSKCLYVQIYKLCHKIRIQLFI